MAESGAGPHTAPSQAPAPTASRGSLNRARLKPQAPTKPLTIMKTSLLRRSVLPLAGMLISAAPQALAQPPFQPVGGVAIDPQETQQLDDMFAQARAAAAVISPGPDAG